MTTHDDQLDKREREIASALFGASSRKPTSSAEARVSRVNVYNAACDLCLADAPRDAVSTLSGELTREALARLHGWRAFAPSLIKLRAGTYRPSQLMILATVRGLELPIDSPTHLIEHALIEREQQLGANGARAGIRNARHIDLCASCGRAWDGG